MTPLYSSQTEISVVKKENLCSRKRTSSMIAGTVSFLSVYVRPRLEIVLQLTCMNLWSNMHNRHVGYSTLFLYFTEKLTGFGKKYDPKIRT